MKEEINRDEYGIVTGKVYITDDNKGQHVYFDRYVDHAKRAYTPTRYSWPGHANSAKEATDIIAAINRALEIGAALDAEEIAPKLAEAWGK